jgi:hypothetical protein
LLKENSRLFSDAAHKQKLLTLCEILSLSEELVFPWEQLSFWVSLIELLSAALIEPAAPKSK